MKVFIKEDSRLFDAAVAQIQIRLAKNIGWLDNIFGLTETLIERKDGKSFTSANVYTRKGRYIQVMPCAELGNFCFFYLRDPQTIWEKSASVVKSPFSVVFWYKVDEVSSSVATRNREAVKEQIIAVLGEYHLKGVTYTLGNIYEQPQNVFKGYDYDPKENQFLMHPYAGLRIDGELRVNVPCLKSLFGDFNDDYNLDFNVDRLAHFLRGAYDKDYNLDFDIDLI